MVAAVAAGRGWPYFDPEYETLSARINPPRVVIDNAACEDATLIKLDSLNRHGILLEVVQVLTDLDLSIVKAYISSDGGWFMDVFHVTDHQGNKLTDERIIEHIEQTLGEKGVSKASDFSCLGRTIGVESLTDYTAIEMTGTDRPGLLSEISAMLTSLHCNVVAAEVWTHNARAACMVYVTDDSKGGPIEDPEKLSTIKDLLDQVMRSPIAADQQQHRTDFSMGLTHTERRLHQMMYADRDYEPAETFSRDATSSSSSSQTSTAAAAAAAAAEVTSTSDCLDGKGRPIVSVRNCVEKGYSVVNVQCRDRPKLLFDTVCTLTDMQYVVFHATIDSQGPYAYQEYYIRHLDGCTLKLESERQRVIKCLEAAILRRVSEGVRLELCTKDRVGLLSDITRIFRENGLSVTRAEVTTRGEMAVNVFYVADCSGNEVDMKVVEAIREEVGHAFLQVKKEWFNSRGGSSSTSTSSSSVATAGDSADGNYRFGRFSLGSFFRSHSEKLLYNLGLLRSYSE